MNPANTTARVALVTGAGGGIGRAIAIRLAGDGCVVVAVDIDRDAAAATLAALPQRGSPSRALAMDVTDPRSIAEALADVDRSFGRLDTLVNCAGIMEVVDGRKPAAQEISLELWNRVLGVNLTGPFLVSCAALPLLQRSAAGRIVNIASRASRMRAGSAAYAASKTGLVGLSRTLAGEFAAHNITVNCVAPSRVATALTASLRGNEDMAAKRAETPLGRIATPEDIAAAVAYLASDDAAFVTGAVLDVNGGSFMQ